MESIDWNFDFLSRIKLTTHTSILRLTEAQQTLLRILRMHLSTSLNRRCIYRSDETRLTGPPLLVACGK